MKKLFYFGLLGWLAFEILNVYFIMPMPGSQRMNSLSVAYFLYNWRWVLRAIFFITAAYGFVKANWKRKWTALIPLLLVAAVICVLNFRMSADHMFYQPRDLVFAAAADNKVDTNRLVIGITVNDKAKAYPIQFIGFHHMVQDSVNGKPILVTYCTVCRTGRVYDPVINGKHERFRLVGMDHFNAMIEDVTTKTWWRQATGEAVAGKLAGEKLNELYSSQTSLGEWIRLHPGTLIMQEDPSLKEYYSTGFKYEDGTSRSALTGTDTHSWEDKSWVVGVVAAGGEKAYDWNMLKEKRVIEDNMGRSHIAIVVTSNNRSFFAFELPIANASLTINNDTVVYNGHKYTVDGTGIDTSYKLKKIPAYQEFWHSWRTFHPATQIYK